MEMNLRKALIIAIMTSGMSTSWGNNTTVLEDSGKSVNQKSSSESTDLENQNEELKASELTLDDIKTEEDKLVEDNVLTTQAANVSSQTSIKPEAIQESDKRLNTSLSLSAETDFKETSSDDKSYGSNITMTPRYKINSEYSAGAIVMIEKDLSRSFETSMSGADSRVFISKSAFELTDNLKLAPSVRFIYPTSNSSKVRDEMLGGIEFDPAFVYDVSDDLSFSYLPRLRRDFHKYTTNRQNRVLSEYRALQFFSLGYQINEKWSFSPTLLYGKSWSYSGRQQNDMYLTILGLGYQYSKTLSFSVATITGGNVYATERGKDEEIQIFNKEESSFVLGGSIIF